LPSIANPRYACMEVDGVLCQTLCMHACMYVWKQPYVCMYVGRVQVGSFSLYLMLVLLCCCTRSTWR
jgi:hypothetical protein